MSDQNTTALFYPIPCLQKSETVLVNQDNDIAEIFFQTYIPPLPKYEAPKKRDV